MPFIYDSYDLFFSEEGDYVIQDSDIKSTHDDPLRGVVQDIQSIIKYEAGDFKLANTRERGVAFLPTGQPNTPETAERWDNAITTALTVLGTIDSNDLRVESFPINWDALFTLITLDVEPTDDNGGTTQIQIPVTVSIKTGEIIYY